MLQFPVGTRIQDYALEDPARGPRVCGGNSLFVIGIELDTQSCSGISLQILGSNALERDIIAGVIKDRSVHDLDRGGMMPENQGRGLQRFEKIAEHDDHDGFRLRQGNQPHLQFENDSQRSFRADNDICQVHWLRAVGELVEVVTAHAA